MYLYIIYFVWTLVDILLIFLRLTSLMYMIKSYRFLANKQKEKERRKDHLLEKKAKAKRLAKKELAKKILEKRSEQILHQQRINR